MTDKQQVLMEYTVQDMAAYLMEDQKVDMEDALLTLYSSNTFSKLSDPESGLYLQGSAYVYDMLQAEMADQADEA